MGIGEAAPAVTTSPLGSEERGHTKDSTPAHYHTHALGVSALPLHHRDPFDRLLIAQAEAEGMTILTADRAFGRYRVKVFWCG